MILAKPLSIAAGAFPAGGSTYNLVGTRFFLLAASEPLNVQLYRGSTLVGDFSGFNGGMKAGPYCEAFTSVRLSTQSALAGNALIGVGDEDMDYNPVAGTLNFTNPGANTSAISPATNAQISGSQANFSALLTIAASVGQNAIVTLGNITGQANGKTATVNSVTLTNNSAGPMTLNLGLSTVTGLSNVVATPTNLYGGGPGPSLSLFGGAGGSLGGPPNFDIFKVVTLAAAQVLDIDFSGAPPFLPLGKNSFAIESVTADASLSVAVQWSEK